MKTLKTIQTIHFFYYIWLLALTLVFIIFGLSTYDKVHMMKKDVDYLGKSYIRQYKQIDSLEGIIRVQQGEDNLRQRAHGINAVDGLP